MGMCRVRAGMEQDVRDGAIRNDRKHQNMSARYYISMLLVVRRNSRTVNCNFHTIAA